MYRSHAGVNNGDRYKRPTANWLVTSHQPGFGIAPFGGDITPTNEKAVATHAPHVTAQYSATAIITPTVAHSSLDTTIYLLPDTARA